MTKCWYYCPERRPSFTELVSWTEVMLRSSANYLDLSPSIFHNALYLQPITHSSQDDLELGMKKGPGLKKLGKTQLWRNSIIMGLQASQKFSKI